jgi:hypothetical protein
MHKVLGIRPPKVAKGDYTRFRELVGAALGGETPFEELEAATRAVWVAILGVPESDTSSRLSAATLLKPFRWDPPPSKQKEGALAGLSLGGLFYCSIAVPKSKNSVIESQ